MVKEILARDWDQTGAGEEPPRHSAYFLSIDRKPVLFRDELGLCKTHKKSIPSHGDYRSF